MQFRSILAAGGVTALALSFACPAAAQSAGQPGVSTDVQVDDTVYSGDYLSVGLGLGYGPSYTGSDDESFFPIPLIQGSFHGVDINPRPGGIALDFIPDRGKGPHFSAGVLAKIDRDRVSNIKDPVVEQLGELSTGVEVGPTVGVSFPQVLDPYDSLSFTVDASWDVAGASNGMTVAPTLTYFTPLSRAMAASLSFSGKFVNDDYADYYYTVTPAQSVTTGGALPAYKADGGFSSLGANLLLGYDLNGDLTDGGLALFGIAGYSHLYGAAHDTPLTSVRGSAEQWIFGLGVGYTF